MFMLLDIAIAALILAGAFLTLVAALGLFRLPDLYTRMHAASKAGTAGSGLLLLAIAIQSGATGVWIKCLLAIVFIVLTAPVSAHLLAKAAARSGQRLPGPDGDAADGRDGAERHGHDAVMPVFHERDQ